MLVHTKKITQDTLTLCSSFKILIIKIQILFQFAGIISDKIVNCRDYSTNTGRIAMNKRTSVFIVFLLIAGLVPACRQASSETNSEADLAALNEFYAKYMRYAEAGDLDNFMSLFEEDALRGEPGIPLITGRENIRKRFSEIFSLADSKVAMLGEGKMEVCGDLAYGYREATLSSTPKDGGPVMTTDMKVLTIFKKQEDGSWKIHIDQINYHPAWSADSIPASLKSEKNPYY